MARYVFSQGKVEVEEGVYVSVLRRDRRLTRAGMLLIVPAWLAEAQPVSMTDQDKEIAHASES